MTEKRQIHGQLYKPALMQYGGNSFTKCYRCSLCDRCLPDNPCVPPGHKHNDLCIQCTQELNHSKTIELRSTDDYDIYGYPKEWHVTPF